MKTRLIPLLLVACCFTAFVRAESNKFSEPLSQTHPFDANGVVTIENVNGAIVVRTWDRAEIKIEAEKRAPTTDNLERIGLAIDVSPGRAHLKAEFPKRTGFFGGNSVRGEVRFTVTVPANVELREISSVNGSIDVSGVQGRVALETVNGRIEAEKIGSDAVLKTVNGSVRATFARWDGSSHVHAKTVNGAVKIELPKDAQTALDAKTVNGRIACDFPLKIESTKRNHLRGTIGESGGSVKVETVNGSITIASR